MPPKSIFRQPGAQHFQLVHRSQRDPLFHDEDASRQVLKAIERPNAAKKGKSRADLEASLPRSVREHDTNAKVGEAAIYGVYYDDTSYDYMQHLRHVGQDEDGVESVVIKAPSTSKAPKTKDRTPIQLKDELPAEVLPSASELPRNYESSQGVLSSIAGFQPDLNPHLRQVLEALEDENFVDDELEEDFFGALVAEGEINDDEEFDFEYEEDRFYEEGNEDTGGGEELGEDEQAAADDIWAKFSQFKKEQKGTAKGPTSEDGSDQFRSEGADTIGTMRQMSVIGGKKRRKGASDASGYSMSSSSMFRTQALQTLDERFDAMVEKQYEEDTDDEDDVLSDSGSDISDGSEAPELITTREDFESMMDDFLDNYEVLGRKIRPKMEGETGPEKLDVFRRALIKDTLRERILDHSDDDGEPIVDEIREDKKDRWDCETILTTYSNLENHPRLIRARDDRSVPKIRIDPKTGLPTIVEPKSRKPKRTVVEPISEESEEESDDDGERLRAAAPRPRDESKEDKKARKNALKQERQSRRVDKKANKEQFGIELKHQMKGIQNKEKTKMKKL